MEAADGGGGSIRAMLAQDLERVLAKAEAGERLTAADRKLLEAEAKRREVESSGSGDKKGGEGALLPEEVAEVEWGSLQEAAEGYGYSVRMVKKWRADGREEGQVCPLGWPSRMGAWFERVYHPRKAPARLQLAVQRLLDKGKPEEAAVAEEREALPMVAEQEMGLLAMLGRMRTAEATLHAQYMDAVERQNKHGAAFYQKEWGEAVNRLRALEKSAPAALEAQGVYLRRADVRRELVPLHQSVEKGVRMAIKRERLRLAAVVGSADEFDEAVDRLLDRVFEELVRCDFAAPLVLEEAV